MAKAGLRGLGRESGQLGTGCPEQEFFLESSLLGLADPQFRPQEATKARLAEARVRAKSGAGETGRVKLPIRWRS